MNLSGDSITTWGEAHAKAHGLSYLAQAGVRVFFATDMVVENAANREHKR